MPYSRVEKERQTDRQVGSGGSSSNRSRRSRYRSGQVVRGELAKRGEEKLKIGHLREGEGRPSAMKTKERDSEALITGGL